MKTPVSPVLHEPADVRTLQQFMLTAIALILTHICTIYNTLPWTGSCGQQRGDGPGGKGVGEGTGEEERGEGKEWGEERKWGKGRGEEGGEGGRERRGLRREGKAGRAWELREQQARSLVLRSPWGPCWYSPRWWDTCPRHLPGQAAWSAPCSLPPYPTPSLGSWPHTLKGLGAMGTPVAQQAQHRALHFVPRSAQRGGDTGSGAPHPKRSRTQPRALWAAGQQQALQGARPPLPCQGHNIPAPLAQPMLSVSPMGSTQGVPTGPRTALLPSSAVLSSHL